MAARKKRLKQRAQHLLGVSCASFNLAIDTFNRSSDENRHEFCAILLSHAIETLMKAYLYQRDGRICPKRSRHAFSLIQCLDKCEVPESEKRSVRSFQILRDLAQHNILKASEEIFYLLFSSTTGAFYNMLSRWFEKSVYEEKVSKRNLFVSPGMENLRLTTIAKAELEEIAKVIRRKRDNLIQERLEAVMLLENYLSDTPDEKLESDRTFLERRAAHILRKGKEGKKLEEYFPQITGIVEPIKHIQFSIVRAGGIPITPVQDGETAISFQKLPKKSEGVVAQFFDLARTYAGRKEEGKPPIFPDLALCLDLLENRKELESVVLTEPEHEYLFCSMAFNYLPLGVWIQKFPPVTILRFMKSYIKNVDNQRKKNLVRQMLIAGISRELPIFKQTGLDRYFGSVGVIPSLGNPVPPDLNLDIDQTRKADQETQRSMSTRLKYCHGQDALLSLGILFARSEDSLTRSNGKCLLRSIDAPVLARIFDESESLVA